eukprot:Sspe_Gene.68349::Locus_40322_Transcript_1_1_Confidence_1.000_Length_737::g.68349::m.68349
MRALNWGRSNPSSSSRCSITVVQRKRQGGRENEERKEQANTSFSPTSSPKKERGGPPPFPRPRYLPKRAIFFFALPLSFHPQSPLKPHIPILTEWVSRGWEKKNHTPPPPPPP